MLRTAGGDRVPGDLAGGVDGIADAGESRREGAEALQRTAVGARQERIVS